MHIKFKQVSWWESLLVSAFDLRDLVRHHGNIVTWHDVSTLVLCWDVASDVTGHILIRRVSGHWLSQSRGPHPPARCHPSWVCRYEYCYHGEELTSSIKLIVWVCAHGTYSLVRLFNQSTITDDRAIHRVQTTRVCTHLYSYGFHVSLMNDI